MSDVRTATTGDLPWLRRMDPHIRSDELDDVVRRGRVLVTGAPPVGLLRWGLLWDETPLMHLLFVSPAERRRGVGRALATAWEARMRPVGHRRVLTSTLADEEAQHFYRRAGYRDIGGFVLPGEAMELVLLKELDG